MEQAKHKIGYAEARKRIWNADSTDELGEILAGIHFKHNLPLRGDWNLVGADRAEALVEIRLLRLFVSRMGSLIRQGEDKARAEVGGQCLRAITSKAGVTRL